MRKKTREIIDRYQLADFDWLELADILNDFDEFFEQFSGMDLE